MYSWEIQNQSWNPQAMFKQSLQVREQSIFQRALLLFLGLLEKCLKWLQYSIIYILGKLNYAHYLKATLSLIKSVICLNERKKCYLDLWITPFPRFILRFRDLRRPQNLKKAPNFIWHCLVNSKKPLLDWTQKTCFQRMCKIGLRYKSKISSTIL